MITPHFNKFQTFVRINHKGLFIVCCFVFIFINDPFCQSYPPGTKHIKRIESKTFKKKKILESKILLTCYDSLWKELKNENTLQTGLNEKTFDLTLLDSPEKKIYAEINKVGDTLNHTINLYNEFGKQIQHILLKGKDTAVCQLRKYDANGNNTELYNRKVDGKYYLSMTWKYDSKNEVILTEGFNQNGALIRRVKKERSEDGKVVKTYKFTKEQGYVLSGIYTKIDACHSKTEYFLPSEGINYGINLIYEKGSYSEIEEDKNGNLLRLEIYNPKGQLTTQVIVTFEDVD